MRRCLALTSFVVLIAGCMSTPGDSNVAPKPEPSTAAAKARCDAPTGSRVPRCGPGDNVETISRQELEARGVPWYGSPPLLDNPAGRQ